MSERERPWLRAIEGDMREKFLAGTDGDAPPTNVANNNENESSENIKNGLVHMWVVVTSNPPEDWMREVKQSELGAHKENVAHWPAIQLLEYLKRNDIWSRPTFTCAVTDEVRDRMLKNNFEPRKE